MREKANTWTSRSFAFVFIFCCISLIGWGLLFFTHFSFNASASLPYKGFVCVRYLPVKKGDLVSISGHDNAYVMGSHFTKRISGVAGDKISVQRNNMFIGRQCVGPLRTSTLDGRSLTPLKMEKIPKGYVFVSGIHPHSFDSRYQEFGLVKENCIQGKCFGLFKKELSR